MQYNKKRLFLCKLLTASCSLAAFTFKAAPSFWIQRPLLTRRRKKIVFLSRHYTGVVCVCVRVQYGQFLCTHTHTHLILLNLCLPSCSAMFRSPFIPGDLELTPIVLYLDVAQCSARNLSLCDGKTNVRVLFSPCDTTQPP